LTHRHEVLLSGLHPAAGEADLADRSASASTTMRTITMLDAPVRQSDGSGW